MHATHPTAVKAPDTAVINQWLKSVLADATKSRQLKVDWLKLMQSELPLSAAQKKHLYGIPAKDAGELQAAIARVVDHGGTIHIERDAETGPGLLVVQPNQGPDNLPKTEARPGFSVIIFHCTFDANCQNWHCGWGPGRRT